MVLPLVQPRVDVTVTAPGFQPFSAADVPTSDLATITLTPAGVPFSGTLAFVPGLDGHRPGRRGAQRAVLRPVGAARGRPALADRRGGGRDAHGRLVGLLAGHRRDRPGGQPADPAGDVHGHGDAAGLRPGADDVHGRSRRRHAAAARPGRARLHAPEVRVPAGDRRDHPEPGPAGAGRDRDDHAAGRDDPAAGGPPGRHARRLRRPAHRRLHGRGPGARAPAGHHVGAARGRGRARRRQAGHRAAARPGPGHREVGADHGAGAGPARRADRGAAGRRRDAVRRHHRLDGDVPRHRHDRHGRPGGGDAGRSRRRLRGTTPCPRPRSRSPTRSRRRSAASTSPRP